MGGSGAGSGTGRLDAVSEGMLEHPLPVGRGAPVFTGKARTRLGSRSLAVSLGAILLVVLAITLPFSAKPLHIDDAGFYGSYWGMLPYTITDRPLEKFDVYQVGPVS